MKTKTFDLGHVLSITNGRLCCEIGGVYEILNHMTGDNLYTHVLPRACEFSRPLLLEKFPELVLANLEAANASLTKWISSCAKGHETEGVKMWLMELRMLHPGILPEYEIPSLADSWLSFDPIEELENKIGKEKVTVIQP